MGKQGQGAGGGGSLGVPMEDHRLGWAGDRGTGTERPETRALPGGPGSMPWVRRGPSADGAVALSSLGDGGQLAKSSYHPTYHSVNC